MTGAYVDQDDLSRLLKKPTKATARDCYALRSAIGSKSVQKARPALSMGWQGDPQVREIAIRHWCEDKLMALIDRDRP